MAKDKPSKNNLFGDESKKALRASVGEENRIAIKKEEIKLEEETIKILEKEISLRKKSAELREQEQTQLEKQLELTGNISDEESKRYDDNAEFLKKFKSEEQSLLIRQKELDKLKNIEEKRFENFKKIVATNRELDDINTSIANKLGQQSKVAEKLNIINESQLRTHSVAAQIMDTMGADEKKKALEINEAYKNRNTSVASLSLEYEKGNITQDQLNESIIQSYKGFENILSTVKATTPEMQVLVDTFKSAHKATDAFHQAAIKSREEMQTIDAVMEQFSGIPTIREFNQLIKVNKKDVNGLKIAYMALGAAIGALVGNFALAGVQVQIETFMQDLRNAIELRKKLAEADIEFSKPMLERRTGIETLKIDAETEKNKIETEKKIGNIKTDIGNDILKAEIESNKQITDLKIQAAYAGRKAAIQFNSEMQSSAASFKAAAKTALFGRGLGSVTYGASQLQMAGIGAEVIAQQMSTVSSTMGRLPTADMAAAMSVFAKRSGASGDNIAALNKMFMTTEGATEESSLNLQQGMETMANKSGISFTNLVVEAAEASKEMLGYQIKSGKALTRQIAAAQSIGVSFTEVAKAGKNMVLNYKDSIKSEMELSALLGRQVDLSEVRSKFAMGDTTGAMEALKAQGLNPADMNMFQQQALTQATGMDLDTLKQISIGEMRDAGPLKQGAAGKENKEFLSRTVQAQATLSAEQASISAATAIIDAKLSAEITKKEIEASSAYRQATLEQEKKAAIDAANLQKSILVELNKYQSDYQKQLQNITVAEAKYHKDFQHALLTSTDYLNALADEKRLNIVSTIAEGFVSMLAGAIGAGLMGKLVGKVAPAVAGSAGGGLASVVGGAVSAVGGLFGRKKEVVTRGQPNTITTSKGVTLTKTQPADVTTTRGVKLTRRIADTGGSIASKMEPQPNTMGSVVTTPNKGVTKGKGLFSRMGSMFPKMGKVLGKGLLKKIPFVGAIMSGQDALARAMSGDMLGAVGEVAAGLTSMIPGIGTLASTAISAGLAMRDVKLAADDTSAAIEAETVTPAPQTGVTAGVSSDSNAILQSIQKNDHLRGIVTYKEMQIQTGILSKMFTYDHVRGILMSKEQQTQTGILAKIDANTADDTASVVKTEIGTPSTQQGGVATSIPSDSSAILQSIQKNDHLRGIVTYKEMKIQTGILSKMFTYDHVRGIVMNKEQKTQTGILAKIDANTVSLKEFKSQSDNLAKINSNIVQLVKLTDSIEQLSAATVGLMNEIAIKQGVQNVLPSIILDGKILNSKLNGIINNNRAIVRE